MDKGKWQTVSINRFASGGAGFGRTIQGMGRFEVFQKVEPVIPRRFRRLAGFPFTGGKVTAAFER